MNRLREVHFISMYCPIEVMFEPQQIYVYVL